jgi:hypothetical protein
MFNLFKTQPLLDGFYRQHRISADKEPLLAIGGMLLEYNQYRDSLTLKSRLQPAQLEGLLGSAWEIFDRPGCVELVEHLLTLPNQRQHGDYVDRILLQRVNVNPLAYEVLIDPGNLYTCLERHCEPLFEENGAAFDRVQFDGIGNVTAWDIERAGLVTRYAYNVGWLDERQVLSCLERLHVLAKENYKSWADYYVAYMKSRTLFFEQTETDYIDYVITLRKMYKNPEFPCLKYPL